MGTSFAILAIGLVTPAFLIAGLALASVPIIIHILNRRRFRTVPWAAMEFLLRALRKNRRRLKFEQWLLLAVRCLLLALAGLALARPVGCEQSGIASLAATRSGLHVLVIDNSYSMGYQADRPEARTHLEQARLAASEIIARLNPGGESVAIITSSRPAQALIAAPTYDLESARAAVERIEATAAGTDLPGALRLALEIGRQAGGEPRRHLYILTDSTRSAWESPAAAAALAELGPALAAHFSVTHVNMGRAGQWNHAVLGLDPTSNLLTSKFAAGVIARLAGYGGPAEARVQWRQDDQVLPGGGSVRVEGETQAAQSSLSLRGGGYHVLSADLVSEDSLPIDNVRRRVVNVASALKVLIVEGQRGLRPMEGSAAFLALALAPPRDPSAADPLSQTASYVEPELISDLELGNRVLADYRAVILAGVGQIQPSQADQLRHFVEQGGLLMLFMGEPVSGENYNAVLLPRGLLPGPMVKRVSVTGEQESIHFDFVPTGDLHPLLREFGNEQKSGLDTARIFSYWQVDLAPDARAERVLNFQPAGTDDSVRHDPAVTMHALGEGRVVFVATAADANPEWSFLPAKPAYVALVHELLAGGVNPGDRWLNLGVGESLQVPLGVRLNTAPILTDPDRREISVEQTTDPTGRPVYGSQPLTTPGLYRLDAGSQSFPVVVNVPADEADVRTIDGAGIRKALGGIPMELHDERLAVEQAATKDEGNDYGWSVMLIVLALACAEAFLAMRFGHYRRVPSPVGD
jgi:Mg-chelatase subunit ChlD